MTTTTTVALLHFENVSKGEVQMHTGRPFKVFQDKKDLKWGQHWKERIEGTILSATFLVPIITPSYFRSKACREEFEKFELREKQLGENRLILPVYYLEADEIAGASTESADPIAKVMASRNWADWRKLRFKDLRAAEIESAVADMALTIKEAMRELERTMAASEAVQLVPVPPSSHVLTVDLADYRPEIPVVCGSRVSPDKDAREHKYYAYTRDYDEIVDAKDLLDESELKKLNKTLARRVRTFRKAAKGRIEEA
ncbi:MAG: TIR domain-containing protein, partial [Rhodospirillaceae bacterium]|nr:TIR domain-containing protein [Rhodospirillaceae bacterium]